LLKPDNTALILIDIQGKLATLMHDKDALYHNLQILVQGVQALEIPIFWMEQYPEGLGPTIPELGELLKDQQPFPKRCFSACGQPDFYQQLQKSGRRQILLAGIETHICVYQTARDLLTAGYHVEAVADAISSRTGANKTIGLKKMTHAGTQITSVETALFELLRRADVAAFKQIAHLVK
jgi:nicotinamidase-related amidase